MINKSFIELYHKCETINHKWRLIELIFFVYKIHNTDTDDISLRNNCKAVDKKIKNGEFFKNIQ